MEVYDANGSETTVDYRGMGREELRDLVWNEHDEDKNRVAYDPRFCRMFGLEAGIMLSRFVYWSGKGHDPDGYVYKTKEEGMEEFGFATVYEWDEARHRLEDAGVLEMTRKARRDKHGVCKWGPSPVLHYRVKFARLAGLLDAFEEDPDGTMASIKRCFKPSKVGGLGVNTVDPKPSTPGTKPAKVADSNTRPSSIQTREGHALESVKVTDSFTGVTAGATLKGDLQEAPLIQAGAVLPSADLTPPSEDKDEHSSNPDDDNDTSSDSGARLQGREEEVGEIERIFERVPTVRIDPEAE